MQRTFARPLAQPAEPRVAVIGAGMAGLACAQQLLAAGLHPRVFERARVLGGRCGTRETEAGAFDHGAQDFHDAPGAFSEQLAYWIENGMAMDWRARVVDLDATGGVTRIAGARFVGVPSMQALADDLARGVDLVVDANVRRLVRDAQGQWFVEMRGLHGDVLDGPFETAIVAVAASQAVPLLAEVPALQTQAGAIDMTPVWTLLVAYPQHLPVPYDVALPDDDLIAWLARDSAKPGRPDGERWVVHAAPAWSAAQVDAAPEAVRAALFERFEHIARQDGDRQPPDRIAQRNILRVDGQLVPAPGQEHRKLARRRRPRRPVRCRTSISSAPARSSARCSAPPTCSPSSGACRARCGA